MVAEPVAGVDAAPARTAGAAAGADADVDTDADAEAGTAPVWVETSAGAAAGVEIGAGTCETARPLCRAAYISSARNVKDATISPAATAVKSRSPTRSSGGTITVALVEFARTGVRILTEVGVSGRSSKTLGTSSTFTTSPAYGVCSAW